MLNSPGAEVPCAGSDARVEPSDFGQRSSEAQSWCLLSCRFAFAFFSLRSAGGKSVLLKIKYLFHDLALQAEPSAIC